MTRTIRRISGLACLALLISGGSTALAQGWLAGGSAGISKQYKYEVGGPIENRDESDTAVRVFGGFLFTPNYGAVLSYVDLGTPKYDGPAFGKFTDELEADGWDLSFLGTMAPGDQKVFRIFMTVGAFHWTQKVSYRDSSGFYPYTDTGTSLSWGLGGEVSVGAGGHWGVHFGYQRFTKVGDKNNSGHEYDRSMIAVGVDYRFGR